MKEKFDLYDVNNRIMLIMKEKNLNKNSLSKLLDLSQPALLKIETNKNLPSFKLLFGLIENFPDISSEWLLTGKEPMLKKSNINLQPEDQETLRELYDKCFEEVIALKQKLNDKDKQVSDLIKMNLYLLEREKEGHGSEENSREKRSAAG